MLLVGLTGNYGMGKSLVLSLFRKSGVVTVDSDEIVKKLLQDRDVLLKIRELLGDGVFSKEGTLDKQKVAEVVFRDASLRRSLEDILHPLVFRKVDEIAGQHQGESFIVVEVPLLFERGYEKKFDRTLTVYTSEETALYRLERAGIPRAKALLRLKSQLPADEKVRRSDFSIHNGGTVSETASQLRQIAQEIRKETKPLGNSTRN